MYFNSLISEFTKTKRGEAYFIISFFKYFLLSLKGMNE